MKIIVNGEATETGVTTLEDLCASMGYKDAKVATALNGDFVPVPARVRTPINENDTIEIVAPRQGG